MAMTPAKTAGAPATMGGGPAQPPATAKITKDVVEMVASKVHKFIQNGELNLPQHYSPDNALKSAWLTLQGVVDKDGKPALTVCTRESIANSLLDMIVQGLNPTKKQCYFIVYGKTLTCMRSYFGAMAVAQMVNPAIKDWGTGIVYEGDTFKYGIKNGKKMVQEHAQEIGNVDKRKINAAYCIALDVNGEPLRTEIMTIEEIYQSWKQSKMNPFENGNLKAGSTHGKFTADMALKTVTNKICKIIVNASSDSTLLLERINRSEELADRAIVEDYISEQANTGEALSIAEVTDAGEPANGNGHAEAPEQVGEKGENQPTDEGKAFFYDWDKCKGDPRGPCLNVDIQGKPCSRLPHPTQVDACKGVYAKAGKGPGF